jgi:hypothetical protein
VALICSRGRCVEKFVDHTSVIVGHLDLQRYFPFHLLKCRVLFQIIQRFPANATQFFINRLYNLITENVAALQSGKNFVRSYKSKPDQLILNCTVLI